MRGFDKLDNGEQRQVMARPTKEAKGRTFTWLRTKKVMPISNIRPVLSKESLSLLVKGTCDRLCWMHNFYYRMNSPTKTVCPCCRQAMPKMRKLNSAGRRRLKGMRRRKSRLLNPLQKPLSWIATAEAIVRNIKRGGWGDGVMAGTTAYDGACECGGLLRRM